MNGEDLKAITGQKMLIFVPLSKITTPLMMVMLIS